MLVSNKRTTIALIILSLFISVSLFAGQIVTSGGSHKGIKGTPRAVPGLIDYQGRLTDVDGDAIDGTVSITFAIYDVAGEVVAPLWTETHASFEVESNKTKTLRIMVGK